MTTFIAPYDLHGAPGLATDDLPPFPPGSVVHFDSDSSVNLLCSAIPAWIETGERSGDGSPFTRGHWLKTSTLRAALRAGRALDDDGPVLVRASVAAGMVARDARSVSLHGVGGLCTDYDVIGPDDDIITFHTQAGPIVMPRSAKLLIEVSPLERALLVQADLLVGAR